MGGMHDRTIRMTIEGPSTDGENKSAIPAAIGLCLSQNDGCSSWWLFTSGQNLLSGLENWLAESRTGHGRAMVTEDLSDATAALTTDGLKILRQRISGNICRCAGYPTAWSASQTKPRAPKP